MPQKYSDLVLLIDSNGRFIQSAILSDKSCRKIIYPKIENAIEILTDSHNVRDPEVLICHTGTNNLDFSDPYSVADSIIDFANIAKEKFPSSKVIISGILPRGDSIQNNATVSLKENFSH